MSDHGISVDCRTTSKRYPGISGAVLPVLACLALTVAASEVVAQNLSNLDGQTGLQARTGASVQSTCGQLAAAGTNRNGASATEDLFARCQDMVHTANAINGSGATTFSLGLDAAGANAALQQIAPEEAASQGTYSTEFRNAQGQAIGGRLAALRGGARGFSVSGLNIQGDDGRMLSLNELLRPAGQSGMAAGDEGADWLSGRLGAFVSGSIGTGSSDASSEEAGYDVDFYSLTVGADYRITDSASAGLALGYAGAKSDFDNNGGDMKSTAYNIIGYGTVSLTDRIFVDGSLGYARNDFDISRRIVYANVNRTANGDTDGDEFSASLGGGMDFFAGGVTITPTLRADYLGSKIDGFTENGAQGLNLQFGDQSLRSITGSAGVEASYAISTNWGVVVPQARLAWVHEFDDDSRAITVQYAADPNGNQFSVITDKPDRDYVDLGLSVSTVLPGGNNAFVDYSTVLGHSSITSHMLTLGLRIEF